jgi:predicted NACHT family NTPase
MMQNREERVSKQALLKLLNGYLKAQSEEIDASEFLDQVEEISELLVAQEEEYEFAHLSFQEYLAATQIAQQQQEEWLYDRLNDDWWKSTILLYAAQVNPTTLIRAAVGSAADLLLPPTSVIQTQID